MKRVLRFLLPLVLTVLLVWWLFRKVNFGEMVAIIRDGCDWWWIVVTMLLSILSHIVRAARWRLQLDALSVRPSFPDLCCSIFGCYALNLLFPRLGEIWRCTHISRRTGSPFTRVFGTIVTDRLADTVTVGLLFVLTFVIAHDAIASFMAKYSIGADILRLAANPLVWVAGAAAVLIIFGVMRLYSAHPVVRRCRELAGQLWCGIISVAHMRGRGLFLLYTVLIWGCYFVQLYVAFYAFPFTAALCREAGLGFGLQPCLVAFVLSSIGMAIPSNGGLGPWNLAVMFGLSLYGVSEAEGATFSMLVWSAETVMLIILGIFTLGYTLRTDNQNDLSIKKI